MKERHPLDFEGREKDAERQFKVGKNDPPNLQRLKREYCLAAQIDIMLDALVAYKEAGIRPDIVDKLLPVFREAAGELRKHFQEDS